MKSFLKNKSVSSSLLLLLDDFCLTVGLNPLTDSDKKNNESVSFEKWLSLINQIDKQYHKEGLGLDIGSIVQPSHLGITAYITNSAETLEDYLKLSIKYNKIWYNYMPQKIETVNNEISFSWNKPAYYQAGLFSKETAISEEMQVAIFHTRLQQLTNNSEAIFNHINLAIPTPKHVEKYKSFFKCNITFEADQTMLFLSLETLDNPLTLKDTVLLQILEKQADALLIQMSKESNMIEKVNQQILQAINIKNTNIKYIAEQMNMSIRTFQNQLKKHDVSFQKLLIDVRFNLAKQLLKDSKLSLTDISFLLAYNEQTSFNKAFKLWSGVSPSQWRAQYFEKNKNLNKYSFFEI